MASVRRALPLLLILGFLPPLATAEVPGDPPHQDVAANPETPQTQLLDIGRWKGSVVLVDFWASWCGPCRESFPWMAGILDKYRDRGLVVVAINLDEDRAAADAFIEANPYNFEYVFDPGGVLATAFDLQVMPSSILFDRAGGAIYRHTGFLNEKTAEYEAHIVAALEGVETEVVPLLPAKKAGRRVGVRPWQRGLLARRSMFLDCDPLDLAFDDHIYFSKEASSGGRGYGGGGCGCN